METIPYSKVRELNKIHIYTYDLTPDKYETIWQKLKAASKELGIELNTPIFYSLEKCDQKDFEAAHCKKQDCCKYSKVYFQKTSIQNDIHRRSQDIYNDKYYRINNKEDDMPCQVSAPEKVG